MVEDSVGWGRSKVFEKATGHVLESLERSIVQIGLETAEFRVKNGKIETDFWGVGIELARKRTSIRFGRPLRTLTVHPRALRGLPALGSTDEGRVSIFTQHRGVLIRDRKSKILVLARARAKKLEAHTKGDSRKFWCDNTQASGDAYLGASKAKCSSLLLGVVSLETRLL